MVPHRQKTASLIVPNDFAEYSEGAGNTNPISTYSAQPRDIQGASLY
jgi:hypothetical protein